MSRHLTVNTKGLGTKTIIEFISVLKTLLVQVALLYLLDVFEKKVCQGLVIFKT